jgi:tetratricopeptide (TPR) repeat protein
MSFIAELKRRKVFRVGVAYVIVAWPLLEVASVVLPTFNAPEWAMQVFTFLVILGYPVALILAWAFDLTPVARVFAQATVAVLLVAALAGGAYFLRAGPTVFSALQASLVVLPFKNATGDARYDWIEAGLPNLLRTDLLQSKVLRLVGENRVQDVLDGLKVADAGEFRPATLRRIGNLMGVENMVTGSLMKAGDQFRIEANVLQVGTSSITPRGLRVEGNGEESLFTMLDELTRQIRDELGVTGGWWEADRETTELSTRSVEALRLYSEGLALARSGNHLEVARRLEGALEEDAEFAVARVFLAETYDRLGHHKRAVSEAKKAAENLRTASPYEATRIRAVRARLTNDLEAAEKAYQKLCDISPNSAEAFFDLASVQEEKGDLQKAFESLRRVIALDPKHPDTHYAMGRLHYKLGNPSDAFKELNTALVLHLEVGNEEGRAAVLNGLGNTYAGLGQYDKALQHYQESLAIRKEIGDQRGVGVALMNLVVVYQTGGRYDEAIKSAEQAVALSQTIGDRGGLSDAYSTLGGVYEDVGRTEDALRSYQESLRIVRETGDNAALARDYTSIGYINYILGRYLEAFFFHKEALAKRRKIGDKEGIVASLVSIGVVEQVQGRYEDAIEFYLEGLSLARGMGEKEAVAVLLANLSNIHEDQGEYGAALALLSEAETIARQINDVGWTAACLGYLGSTRRQLGDHAGAEEALTEALGLARQINNRPLVAEILTYQGELAIARGQWGQAATVLREATSEAEAAQQHRLGLLARLNAAKAGRSVGDLEAVLKEAQAFGLAPLVAPTRLAMARVHLDAGRLAEARREAELAIDAGTPLLQRDLLFQAHHLAGVVLERRGETEPASEHYVTGLTALAEMRQGLKNPSLRHLLDRPETTSFATDAERLFQVVNRPQELERLRLVF